MLEHTDMLPLLLLLTDNLTTIVDRLAVQGSSRLLLLLLLIQAFHEAVGQLLSVQVPSDEHKLVLALLAGLPWFVGWSEVDLLVHALEHELRVALPVEAEESLGAVDIGGALLQQIHHEHVEPLWVEVSMELDSHRLHQLQVVLALLLRLEEVGIDGQDGFHVERVQSKDLLQRRAAALGLDHGGEFVDHLEAVLQRLLLVGLHEVHLVQEDLVGEGDLLQRFVHGSLRLLLIQVQCQMLAIGQADDGVDEVVLADLGVRLHGVHDGGWVGKAGGLQQDGIEVLAALRQLSEGADQVAAHGTTHAPVVHGDQILWCVQRFRDETIVDADFSELILQDADLPLVLLLEDVIHESRLSGSEEASDDRDWCEIRLCCLCHCELLIEYCRVCLCLSLFILIN
mmetsp:Transcript_16097/g.44583  ORF Transcript_16097/g.44583 Transcript_16097/m.44583 type:complete len:398 (+) Transcript_16097:166-1359(+)